jgi:hypothetical protein
LGRRLRNLEKELHLERISPEDRVHIVSGKAALLAKKETDQHEAG